MTSPVRLLLFVVCLLPGVVAAQDGILTYGSTTVTPGSVTPVDVPIFLEIRAGTFNSIGFNIFMSNPGVSVVSITPEPTIAGVTPDQVSIVTNNLTIELDSSATPTPIGPFSRVKIATVSLDASALTAGEFTTVFSFAKTINTGTSTYSAAQVEGAVFGGGNAASQLYFGDENADEVYRVLLDSSGSVLSTTPVVPGPDRCVALAVDRNNIAWVPEFQPGTLKRYNGTTLIDSIAVGAFPGAIGFDVDGSAWIGLRFAETVTKVSAAGEVLYGPGGILGAGFPVTGRPIKIAGDPFGNVYVLTLNSAVAGDGALKKFGPDGQVLYEILYTNAEVVRGIAVDRAGFLWVGMAGRVQILNTDGTLDAEFIAPGQVEHIVCRRTNNAQAGLAPQDSEAWASVNLGGSPVVRRIRRNGTIDLPLTGLISCSFGFPAGIHADGEGQIWALGDAGCAVSIDATTTGLPTVLAEVSTPFTAGFGTTGDASGYLQANVFHPSTGVYADLDADTVTNGGELNLGTNPFIANAAVIPPVQSLTCMQVGPDVDISWSNGVAMYSDLFICINGVETQLLGTATSFTISAALEGVYDIQVQGFDMLSGLRGEAVSCLVVVGPGTVAQSAAVGLSVFDITVTGLAAPDPAYFVTDTGTNAILGLDASFNVIANIGNPFVDRAPRGIAYDPPVNPFAGPTTNGKLIVTGYASEQTVKVKSVDLGGGSPSAEFELLRSSGQSFDDNRSPGGIALSDSGFLLMSGPLNCELFAYDTGGAFFGPTSLVPALAFNHPAPASSLQGIEVESFDASGGTIWISQQSPGNNYEIQRASVSSTGVVTLLPQVLTLGAIPETSVGGFGFPPNPVPGDPAVVVGTSTSTVYSVEGLGVVLAPQFTRGDCNDDGTFDIGDLVFALTMLFAMGTTSPCLDACDVNDDGGVDVGDAVYGLIALFSMGTPPPAPFVSCGFDPTPDATDCASSNACP